MVFIHSRPGGGKSTQVDRLKNAHPESAVIQPGRILRRALNPNDDFYQRFNRYVQPYASAMARGDLVPPPDDFFHIMTPLIREEIVHGKRQFLFESFARSKGYLDKLNEFNQALIDEGNEVRTLHIYMITSNETATARITGRRETEMRVDDGNEVIRNRMEVFRTGTFPMLQELYERGELIVIRGDKEKKENVIQQEVDQIVDRFLTS